MADSLRPDISSQPAQPSSHASNLSRSVTPTPSPPQSSRAEYNGSRYMDLQPRLNDPSRSSVRIRRLPSLLANAGVDGQNAEIVPESQVTGQRSSDARPQRGVFSVGGHVQALRMPPVDEDGQRGHQAREVVVPTVPLGQDDEVRSATGSAPPQLTLDEYHSDLVDVLDVTDPEVSTLSTLTNLQNSLFVPDLGSFLNRRPMYTLTPTPTLQLPTMSVQPPLQRTDEEKGERHEEEDMDEADRPGLAHTSTIDSTLSESRFAVLPHGQNLEGWTAGEKDELNNHVRHMLHSKRSKFKRSMRGFGQYIKRPLGFIVTLYATLITLFGLAWVLFLIGWINVGGKQLYLINIIDYTLVALFAIVGDGLIPWRTWDTYNMIFIAHYHHLTWKLRKKAALPKLENKNDLPAAREDEVGVEEAKQGYYSILNAKQQASLLLHQGRFCRSHTFYKPHETITHFAFPIKYLVTIVTLLDFHSVFQVALGACTFGIPYKKRPPALTTVILCCSITCNITAGVLISVGDHKTRKKEVFKRMFRQELTAEAIDKVERNRLRKAEEAEEEQLAENNEEEATVDDDEKDIQPDQEVSPASGESTANEPDIDSQDFGSVAHSKSKSSGKGLSPSRATSGKDGSSSSLSHAIKASLSNAKSLHEEKKPEPLADIVKKQHKAMELTEIPHSERSASQHLHATPSGSSTGGEKKSLVDRARKSLDVKRRSMDAPRPSRPRESLDTARRSMDVSRPTQPDEAP